MPPLLGFFMLRTEWMELYLLFPPFPCGALIMCWGDGGQKAMQPRKEEVKVLNESTVNARGRALELKRLHRVVTGSALLFGAKGDWSSYLL